MKFESKQIQKPIKIATCDIRKWLLKMEAAGIEPASRDASTLASTCVVGLLRLPEGNPFAHCGAARQAPPLANSNHFLARRVSSRTADDPEL